MALVKSKMSYENLYVTLNRSSEKRKLILNLIKGSLSFQEQIEKFNQIRSLKKDIKEDIKKLLLEINNEYQLIQKNLPNVKNIVSYGEKEVDILNRNIDSLKQEIKIDKKLINKQEDLVEKLEEGPQLSNSIQNSQVQKEVKKSVTKTDRIKSNLKFIEEKLKTL